MQALVRSAGIVILDEGQNFGFQMLSGGEAAALAELADQDAQPDLDLIHPRAMLGCVVKDDPVGRVGQEGRPRCHRLQDATLAFDAQVAREIGFLRYVAD